MTLVHARGWFRTALASLPLLVSTANLQAQQTPFPQSAAEQVILDTDIGDDIDDVFALGIALTSPEIKLIGITSAWGDTSLRSRMIDRILCETGRDDIPVYTGVPTHRQDAAAFSQAPWSRAGIEHQHGDAVTFLLDQARSHPGKITLLAIAPLTNIGAAIDRDPAAFRLFRRVVLMGGSIDRGYGPRRVESLSRVQPCNGSRRRAEALPFRRPDLYDAARFNPDLLRRRPPRSLRRNQHPTYRLNRSPHSRVVKRHPPGDPYPLRSSGGRLRRRSKDLPHHAKAH